MASDKGEDGDELGLDLPEECELWEQLKAPELWMAAALALREIWRHSEGPFAVDEVSRALVCSAPPDASGAVITFNDRHLVPCLPSSLRKRCIRLPR